jgi:VIT1/CCC1 family predicted Fe2+/Mn2+ transporter
MRESRPPPPDADSARGTPLDPIDRVSELVFGVLMAMSITGAFSVAGGDEEARALPIAALGCNLAWGLTDGVMYLVGLRAERRRAAALLRGLEASSDRTEAYRILRDGLPGTLGAIVNDEALEALRRCFLSTNLPDPGLRGRDWAAALGVCLWVVVSTLPVALPFLLISEPALAVRTSNGMGVLTLFAAGFFLGKHAKDGPFRHGLFMAAIGVVLVLVIIALGG